MVHKTTSATARDFLLPHQPFNEGGMYDQFVEKKGVSQKYNFCPKKRFFVKKVGGHPIFLEEKY